MCKAVISPGGLNVIRRLEQLFGKRRVNSKGFLTLAVTVSGLSESECTLIKEKFREQGYQVLLLEQKNKR